MATISNPINVESVIRRRGDVPDAERARELIIGDDTHSDPDEPRLESRERPESVTDWRVAKALLALRQQVNEAAPNRDKSSDGTIGDERHCGGAGASDHCPNVMDGDTGIVTAMDITHDPENGCDSGIIAAAICASGDIRVKYIIWNRRIANSAAIAGNPPWTWRPYNGSNPHNKHVHISVKPSKAGPEGYDTTTPWSIAPDSSSPVG